VKIVDANVLIYAMDEDAPHHTPAKRWLDHALCGGATVGFSWTVLAAFCRISTNTRIFSAPLSTTEALDAVDGWLAQPSAAIIEPTARHTTLLRELLSEAGLGGSLTNDAHLAALAIEHRGTIVSFDRDFQRFSQVRCELPSPPS
jgi:toxin-antitoxin system PIN domain toxin